MKLFWVVYNISWPTWKLVGKGTWISTLAMVCQANPSQWKICWLDQMMRRDLMIFHMDMLIRGGCRTLYGDRHKWAGLAYMAKATWSHYQNHLQHWYRGRINAIHCGRLGGMWFVKVVYIWVIRWDSRVGRIWEKVRRDWRRCEVGMVWWEVGASHHWEEMWGER